jgi:phosphomannomutase/phosphoglucomutase
MLAASAIAEKYLCPGEAYRITASVHFSRLAAFYSKCRHCPYAPGAESAAETTIVEEGAIAPVFPESPLFTGEGVRGKYLNELTRTTAAEIAGAMASCLWDEIGNPPAAIPSLEVSPDRVANEFPEDGAPTNEGVRLLKSARPGPCVVVAHDERPSSPDIVTGVGQALRRMGCQVVDVGLTTRPALLFAIDHLQAAGGVYVTGAGCDPGWTGLDFLARDGIPCSRPGQLDRIGARYRSGYARPSRSPGSQRVFQAMVPYQAGLWKHFHALRPLKIALACPSRAVLEVFQLIFRNLACRLIPVETPTRARSPQELTDPDVARTSQAVRATGADLGLLIEDDGEQCTFFDDQGAIVAPWNVARLLAEIATADRPATANVVLPAAWTELPFGSKATYVESLNREAVMQAFRREQGLFGADGQGRYWFAEAYPACDAVLTLVHLLHALSRSDTPFSEVAA